MLAFLGPVQILIMMVVLLLVFGPDKLPEMGKQFGKALRELMKAKQDFIDSIKMDDPLDFNYKPPRYEDSYDSSYNGYNGGADSTDDGVWRPSNTESGWQATIPTAEPTHGDFSAAAFSDTASDFGVAPTPVASPVSEPSAGEGFAPPTGTVPREKK